MDALALVIRTVTSYCCNTKRGYIGKSMGLPHIKVGDHFYLLDRGMVPWALRPVQHETKGPAFEVAGDCYVHTQKGIWRSASWHCTSSGWLQADRFGLMTFNWVLVLWYGDDLWTMMHSFRAIVSNLASCSSSSFILMDNIHTIQRIPLSGQRMGCLDPLAWDSRCKCYNGLLGPVRPRLKVIPCGSKTKFAGILSSPIWSVKVDVLRLTQNTEWQSVPDAVERQCSADNLKVISGYGVRS